MSLESSESNNPLNEPSALNDSLHSEPEVKGRILSLYDPLITDEVRRTTKLDSFYVSLNSEGLGFAQENLDKSNIASRKAQLGKRFNKEAHPESVQENKLVSDGLYTGGGLERADSLNLLRLQKRLIRDSREEFYDENGEVTVSNEFLDEKVSRLINISFEGNPSLAIYQKNAILSMRDNQSKSESFELEIVLGRLLFKRHPLKVEEERKFEEISPLLEWMQKYLEYPLLPHLAGIEEALNQGLREQINRGERADAINETRRRIDEVQEQSREEGHRVEDNMKSTLRIWEEIKGIRRTTMMSVVPWRLQVREFKHGGKDQYEIGVVSSAITQESVVHESERVRRHSILEEKYYVRVLINGNVVSQSSKVGLQWPGFTATFNEKLKINLYTKPSVAVLEIVSAGLWDRVVDTVNIKLPGEHANTLTSSERLLIWQDFYSSEGKKEEGKGPAGTVSYRTEWKGAGPKMPPSRAVFADEDDRETTGNEETLESIEDPNDPRRILSKYKNRVKQPDRSPVFRDSELPFSGIISTRQLLLKLREKSHLDNVVIPLTEEAIRKRPDLLDLIKREKELAVLEMGTDKLRKVYNPVDGIFREQSEETKERIKAVLRKIPLNKHSSSALVNTHRYKLVNEVISEYTFDEMVSPLVVFFQDLFTQRRKLGPKKHPTVNARNNITEFELSLQANSAWNVPMRDSSGNMILRYRQIRNEVMEQLLVQEVGLFAGMGFTLFQQQPNVGGNAFQYYNNSTGQMGLGVRDFNVQVASTNHGMQQFMSNANVNYNYPQDNNAQDMLSNIDRVRPFLEISYGNQLKRTREVEGVSPEWNEEVGIKVDCVKEKSTLEQLVHSTGKFVYVTLFDMHEESQPTNTLSELKVKKTKYYLGNIVVPLATFVTIPKLSGFFKINRPLMIFGFTTMPQPILGQEEPEGQYKNENPLVPTHLSLNISVAPAIDSSFAFANDRKFLNGEEKSEFLQYASDWLDQLNIKRYIRLWVNNANGKSVFISRFICDITPPPLRKEDEPEKWIERTARFVSLIPYKSSCKLLDNTEEFHLTLREFLDVKMGDDHAFLLCSCFNAIDKLEGRQQLESYVVVGKAFPEGKTTYVMRRDKESKEFELWNPRSGECYYLNEEASKHVCPLLEVGCVVSVSNVFVNTQGPSHPFEISFDLEDDGLWKPFLTEQKSQAFFNGRVPSAYQFEPITLETYGQAHSKAEEIQMNIYNYVKTMMETDRKKLLRPHTFRVNIDLSNFVRQKMLMEMEIIKSEYRLTGSDSPLYSEKQRTGWGDAWFTLEKLKDSLKNKVDTDRRLFGFPLNMPFTTLDDVWEEVSRTQIHLNEREDMEFVLAVKCMEYPCFLTSVWVFVGTVE